MEKRINNETPEWAKEMFKNIPVRPMMCGDINCFHENVEIKSRLKNAVEIDELVKISEGCKTNDCGNQCKGFILCDHLRLNGLIDALKEYIENRNKSNNESEVKRDV